MAVFNLMVKQNLTNVLILEDDATLLTSNWSTDSSLWKFVLKDLPFTYDMVMLSSFGNLRRQGEKVGKNLFLAQASRVSRMYVLSRKGARNMLRTLPIVAPMDFQINWAGSDRIPKTVTKAPVQNISIFWSEPPMGGQHDATGRSGTVGGRKRLRRLR